MKVMHVLCSLIATAIFGVVQAQHRAFLEQAVWQERRGESPFSWQSNVPTQTLRERFMRFKNYLFAPKPQISRVVVPTRNNIAYTMAQEKLANPELIAAKSEYDKALEEIQKDSARFKKASESLTKVKHKLFDLNEPQRLEQEVRKMWQSRQQQRSINKGF